MALYFSSGRLGKRSYGTSKQAMSASFHILSIPLFTSHPTILHDMIIAMTASFDKPYTNKKPRTVWYVTLKRFYGNTWLEY